MKKVIRKNNGSVMVETAFAVPVFLLIVFSFFEVSRALYVMSTLGAAAQKVASKISTGARRSPNYSISGFAGYTNGIRFPGSVIDSSQFSFDVTNPSNSSTVSNGQADGATSTKVVVTVSFPPANNNTFKIPIFDPGNLINRPIFGASGLKLSSSATCFLERSRRPTLN